MGEADWPVFLDVKSSGKIMDCVVDRTKKRPIVQAAATIATYYLMVAVIANAVAAVDISYIPKKGPECAPNPGFTTADFSVSLVGLSAGNRAALTELRRFNVTTVFRYYDHVNETLPGKTLHRTESDAILAAGMRLGVVFQHHNDDPAKFLIPEIGRKDADRALALALENKQPRNSAIYFGVDGPERHLDNLIKEYISSSGQPMSDDRRAELQQQHRSYFIESYQNFLDYGPVRFNVSPLDGVNSEMMKPVIAQYFKEIRTTFDADAQRHGDSGYKIGMYCTAAMCLLGDDQRLADYFWVSPEGRNDPEYRTFLSRDGHWHLVQQLPTKCAGWGPTPDHQILEFDFNFVSPKRSNFGQWGTKKAR
jgi:hypothetical protein